MTSPIVAQENQKLALDAPVELYELDVTSYGDQVYYFTPAPLVETEDDPPIKDVTWRGETWVPVPCESSGWTVTGKGALPRPQLKLANVNLQFSALCIAFSDLIGCPLTRHRTFRKFLDDGDEADTAAEQPPELYRVERKLAQNKLFVEFELSCAADFGGRQLPAREILANLCTARQRRWNGADFDYDTTTRGCPYVDSDYFDINGVDIGDPALEVFSKRVATCCKPRFPDGPLPFFGFPGLSQVPR